MFENYKIAGEYATRYIASWLRKGGRLYYLEDVDKFCEWLSSMGLNNDEVAHIRFLATCGKLELETSAMKFLNNKC